MNAPLSPQEAHELKRERLLAILAQEHRLDYAALTDAMLKGGHMKPHESGIVTRLLFELESEGLVRCASGGRLAGHLYYVDGAARRAGLEKRRETAALSGQWDMR